jgi:hypothetical protein
MSCFAFSLPLFHWMLEFALAPRLPLVSIQNQFIQTGCSPLFLLAAVTIFAVQSGYIRLQEGGSDLALRLKSQIACYFC